MPRHRAGGLQGLILAFAVALATAGCLQHQVAAESSAWHSRDQQHQEQQQHQNAGHYAWQQQQQDPSPAARGQFHQPGIGKAAAAPRPGSPEQQVFGSDGLSTMHSISADAGATTDSAAGSSTHHQQHHRPKVPLLAVTVMSAVMSLMSCLGVLPYFFCSKLSTPWAGVANAVASGVMLAASFGLLAEGAPYGGTYLILGMLLGVVFVKFSQEHLEQYEVDSFEQLAGADARKVILFLAVMAVHAVGEGGGVGVSFAGDRGWAQGTLVTLAIGLHNVPEGLAVATVMAAKGTSPRRALLWTALTALPQALVAPPAYVFVETFRALLPLAMGFAAGCMMWVVIAELLPDALEAVDSEKVATCATASAAWLQGLSIWIAHLETPAGTLASPFGNYTAVLPLGIMPLLPQFAPIVILPTLLATAGSRLRLPPVLLTAASAGLLAAYAGCCWLQLLISSPHRVLGGLLAPAVGAAVAAALWQQLLNWQQQGWSPGLKLKLKPGSPLAHHYGDDSAFITALPLRESPPHAHSHGAAGHDSSCCSGVSDDSASSEKAAYIKPTPAQLPGEYGTQQHQQQHQQQQHQQMMTMVPGSYGHHPGVVPHVLTTPAAPHLGTMQLRHQRASDSGSAGPAPAGPWGSQQQQHQHAVSMQQQQHQPWQPSAPAAGWDQQQQQQRSPTGSSISSTSSNHSSSSSPLRAGGVKSLLLPGRGDVLLHVTGPHAAAAAASNDKQRRKRDSWGFAGSLHSRVQGSSQAVAAASMLSLGGAVAAAVPLGLQLAAALTTDPTNSGHVVVPMVLLGCVLSLGSLGFLVLLLSTARKRLVIAAAGLISSMPVLVAVAALLSQPAWVGQGSARVAADGLQGLSAGFNLLVVLLLLLPTVRRWGPKAAAVGAWGGAATGVLLCAGVAALCFGTPYCLHVHPSVVST